MQSYHNSAVLQFDDAVTGNAAVLATVTVRVNSTQNLAVIYDLDDVVIANPSTTDLKGNYAFKALDDVYDIIISEGTGDESKLEKVNIFDQANLQLGILVFTTYALLDAYTPANTAEEKSSFKVTNDVDTSLNGYYHWVSGTTYDKDNDLANGIVESGNVDSTSGGTVFNSIIDNRQLAETSSDLLFISGTEVGFINATNGVLQATAGFTASGFIPVKVGTAIRYSGRLSSATVGVCIYDIDRVYLSTLLSDAGNVDDALLSITNPNAFYIRTCTSDTFPGTYSTSVHDSDKPWGLEFLPFDLVDYDIVTDGKAIRSTDGMEVSLVGNSATGFIPVIEGQRIRFTGRNFSSIGSCIYDEDKAFISSLVGTEETLKDLWVIPAGAKFLRGTTYNTNPLTLESNVVASSESPDIKIRFTSSIEFYVDSKMADGTYLNHRFAYLEDVARADVGWRSDWISHNETLIVQGNFNLVHITDVVNENKFVGLGHGCETYQWIQFFLDGKEFDPATATGEISGSKFSFQFYSDIYRCDESAEPGGELTSPLIPLELSTNHYMDCSISADNLIERYNKLIVQRTGLSFKNFYAAMQQTQQGTINGNITVNKDLPFRSYFPVSNDVAEPLPPSTTPLVDGTIGGGANQIIAIGSSDGFNYRADTKSWNVDSSQRAKHSIQAWVSRTTANKFYFTPIVSSANAVGVGLPTDVFNIGDVIECRSKTTINVTSE